MEEGTGGQRKGRKRRKEMRRELRWKRERGQCSLFSLSGHLFHFSKFTQDSLDEQGQSRGSLSFCRPKSQSLLGN